MHFILGAWLVVMPLDAATTHVALNRGAQEVIWTSNPWVNDGIVAGETVAVFWALRHLHQTQPKTAIGLGIAFVAFRGVIAAHNWDVAQRQGRINARH